MTKPEIKIHSNPEAIREIRAAILAGALPKTFVADGRLVHIESVSGTVTQALDEDSPLPVRANALTGPLLSFLLAHHVELRRIASNGLESEWSPPSGVLSAVLAASEWRTVDIFAGIVGVPIIRRDGSLLQQPGYDPATGLFLAPSVVLKPIDEAPSADKVAAARRFLLADFLGDFDWKAEADRANYVGLLVTPFLRRHLRCVTPLGIITASMPGSGKSILSGAVGLLAGQKTLAWADDDAELRKAISSAFMVESGVVVWDNLEEGTAIASPILANLLTNPVWSDRILGTNRVGSWANERLWLVNGNNLRVGGDIASRSVLVRLAPKAPHPEERTGFRIPNLDAWIVERANQAKVMRAVLTMILDWTRAGSPKAADLPNMRQFTPWAHGIGGFLAHHNIGGFLGNLDAVRASDDEDAKWAAFLSMWMKRHGSTPKTAREIFADAALDETRGIELDPWNGTFITGRTGRRPNSAVQLGQWLTRHNERPHDDLRVQAEEDSHVKIKIWKVERFDRGVWR